MDRIRSLVRPFVMITGWTALLYLAVFNGMALEFFLGQLATIIGYWFAERKK